MGHSSTQVKVRAMYTDLLLYEYVRSPSGSCGTSVAGNVRTEFDDVSGVSA
jgi:hypothetical protein